MRRFRWVRNHHFEEQDQREAAQAESLHGALRALQSDLPPPIDPEAGKARLLAVVGAIPAPSPARPRFRFTALAVAALSGLGLLAASAATGSDPVTLVRETVTDLPRRWTRDRAEIRRYDLHGTVRGVDEGGRRFELETDEGTVRIELGSDVRVTDLDDRTTNAAHAFLRPGDIVAVQAEGRDAGSLDARTVTVDRTQDEPPPVDDPTSVGAVVDEQPDPSATATVSGAGRGPTATPAATPAPDPPPTPGSSVIPANDQRAGTDLPPPAPTSDDNDAPMAPATTETPKTRPPTLTPVADGLANAAPSRPTPTDTAATSNDGAP